jgi:SAM-dependent methyltransferase
LHSSFIDLGSQPLSNAYVTAAEAAAGLDRTYPLHVRVCPSCLLVQVDEALPADAIFTADYAYFSSYSASWLEHAKRYAGAMIERFGLGTQSMIVEIASNDGYLLKHFVTRGIPVLGIEPTRNTAEAAIAKGIPTDVAFFGRTKASELAAKGFAADLIAANNVLAHVPDIADFVAAFPMILKPQGVATFEFPHLLRLIERLQFDTIYHEHYSYLSLGTVERIFSSLGLRVFDTEELPTHGGSLRVFACRAEAHHGRRAGVDRILEDERRAGLDRLSGYDGFALRVENVKTGFLDFLAEAKTAGKTVAAYGAAAKGNTFLNTLGVTAADIACAADRNPAKQGKLMPGSHIPIVAPEELETVRPNYVIILPWNLETEIRQQLNYISNWCGQFVVAVPELRIVDPRAQGDLATTSVADSK